MKELLRVWREAVEHARKFGPLSATVCPLCKFIKVCSRCPAGERVMERISRYPDHCGRIALYLLQGSEEAEQLVQEIELCIKNSPV